jgi:hypothetical protein
VTFLAIHGHKWYADENEFVSTAVMVAKDIQGFQNVVTTWQAHWVVEAAVSDAMITVLQDPGILNYLKD